MTDRERLIWQLVGLVFKELCSMMRFVGKVAFVALVLWFIYKINDTTIGFGFLFNRGQF